MLLLVTNCRDITTDFVVAELKRRSLPFFRLNTELLPQALCVMDGYPRTAWSITLKGKTIRGDRLIVSSGLALCGPPSKTGARTVAALDRTRPGGLSVPILPDVLVKFEVLAKKS